MMSTYIANGLWLISEKLVNTVGVLFITILTARYLGPEKMGVINYALAFGAIITPIAQLGSQTLLFDKTSKDNLLGRRLLISSQPMRKVVFICLFLISILSINYIVSIDNDDFLVFSFVLFSFYFLALDSYRPYFDASLKSKKNSISTQVGILLSLAFRFLLVKISAGFFYFSIPYIINHAIPYFIKKNIFKKDLNKIEISKRRKKKYKEYMMATGFPLVIANLSIVIYVKVANILLASLSNISNVAIYNAAVTLSQGWVFFPMSILTVLFAKVFNEKDQSLKDKGYSFIILLCTIISATFCLIIFLFKKEILMITYGEEYISAVLILPTLAVAGLFSLIGTVGYRVIIHHGGYKFLMKKMLIVCVFNVFLSYLTIKEFGILGAAYSILITEILSSTILNYFYSKKSLLKIHLGSVSSLSYIRTLK
ncbi:oligosaccharide flippase family protein [Vibrio alginolyticus]|uniref:oligosaccharide flippase family protein n=2 Tax=Vibrio TaxID=662 RepID=UPI0016475829|nr:oligosaccharide flippase family protein [Vibrio alginolyticus]MDW2141087.1 oligosaccharide flippase family protein [Vibrio sp. 1833]QNI26671.1 oligosaccharide flippase family protein [Vibrio alginolyticus]